MVVKEDGRRDSHHHQIPEDEANVPPEGLLQEGERVDARSGFRFGLPGLGDELSCIDCGNDVLHDECKSASKDQKRDEVKGLLDVGVGGKPARSVVETKRQEEHAEGGPEDA